MLNINNENDDIEVETTHDEDPEIVETDLEGDEATSQDKQKQLREKLAKCEEEKKQILDESTLAKADFLNARKRLEEDRVRDRARTKMSHIEDLLPLCDSFHMAMSDKEAWEKADESWRKGIEGIHSQLQRILDLNSVTEVNPEGETFDPHKHEAVGTEEVEDEKKVDVIINVVQKGYEMKIGDNTETVRTARVTTGVAKH